VIEVGQVRIWRDSRLKFIVTDIYTGKCDYEFVKKDSYNTARTVGLAHVAAFSDICRIYVWKRWLSDKKQNQE